MTIIEELKKALEEFQKTAPDSKELARLQQFLADMKNAGVAKTREYNLPHPDTIGRTSSVSSRRQTTVR